MKNIAKTILSVSFLLAIALVINSFVNIQKDKNSYKTVKIGSQEWMSENLKVNTFRNGDLIPQAKTDDEWDEAKWNKQPAWCYYDYDPANGEKHGKLYNWFAVNDARQLAPEGWHIPGDEEWDVLRKRLVTGIAGGKMKSTDGWNDAGNGTNSSGFNGLPSGYRNYEGFNGIGSEGYWWSSTGSDSQWVSCRYLSFSDSHLHKHNMSNGDGLSVRCIKD
jgi:uncharacterized protein (TIGR02145 family)